MPEQLLEADLRRIGLYAAAGVRLGAVILALRWRGYQRVAAQIPAAQRRAITAQDRAQAVRYARAINGVARLCPAQARCLARSLALHGWLRQHGTPSELQIGVARDDETFGAHAWVEVGGAVVGSAPAEIAPFTLLLGGRDVAESTRFAARRRTAARDQIADRGSRWWSARRQS